jgi:hypothetical protein
MALAADTNTHWGYDGLVKLYIERGYTNEEIAEVIRFEEAKNGRSPHPPRFTLVRIEALRLEMDPGQGGVSARRPGPEPIVTKAQVLAKRLELKAAGKHSGYGSLAKALNVSEATIRRRLAGN